MESSFAIIAEPNRRAILSLLASSERSVGEIERRLRMPQTSVSKHLRVLREAGFVESRVEAQRRVYRIRPEPLMEVDAWLAPFRRFWTAHVDALERHLDRMEQAHRRKERKTMSNREKYVPGPAAGAEVQKDGEKWTLVLVRELRHPPAMVWQALTDPAHLSEWAPFDADRNLAAVGPVKLSTVGSADAAGLRDHREAGRGAEAARVQLGRQRPPVGARAARQRHAPHALAQHRSPLHLVGRRGLAHLLRRPRAAPRG